MAGHRLGGLEGGEGFRGVPALCTRCARTPPGEGGGGKPNSGELSDRVGGPFGGLALFDTDMTQIQTDTDAGLRPVTGT